MVKEKDQAPRGRRGPEEFNVRSSRQGKCFRMEKNSERPGRVRTETCH